MTVRKILGALLIILIGVPILFGVTWAVGLVRATVSSEFLTELPREIIAEIPNRADEIFLAAQNENIVSDPGTRAWFQAAAKTGISPRDLMKTTGLQAWMEGELSASLGQVGEVLRGEKPLRSISINLKPLKEALLHPDVDRFLEGTMANLPPCDEKGLQAWQDLAVDRGGRHELPACRPDPAVAKEVLFRERVRAVRDMDDKVEVFEDVRPFPFHRLGITRAVTMASYLLFIIPALIILLGVFIAAPSPASRLRWSGISVMAGGIPVLLMALVIKKYSLWALNGGFFSWRAPWSNDFGELILDKLGWIPSRIIDGLFSPVISVAAIVMVIGIVLLALSSTARTLPKSAKN